MNLKHDSSPYGMAGERILSRIAAAEKGNFGMSSPLAVAFIKCAFIKEPGYRLYYTRRGGTVYFFLLGGDKSTQPYDIQEAVRLATMVEKERT